MTGKKKQVAKATPVKSASLGRLKDEGGWTLGQVLLWFETRNVERVLQMKTDCGTLRRFEYRAMPKSPYYDPDYPTPVEGESDDKLSERIQAYRKERVLPPIIRAREEFLQELRAGTLIAQDMSGQEIPTSRWQAIDLRSEAAIKLFLYPSKFVRKLWPEPAPRRPTDEQVKNLVSEIYQESHDGPIPKQDAVKREVRSRLRGATFKQINAALAKIPKTAKN